MWLDRVLNPGPLALESGAIPTACRGQAPDLYRYINSQKEGTQGIQPLKRRNGSGLAESELNHADEFNVQFTDVVNIHGRH